MHTQEVLERAQHLKGLHDTSERERIRAVMNGGALGLHSVLNWGKPYQGPGSGKGPDSSLGVDLPTANFMYSAMERVAQRIGREPTIKTDMIPTRDTDKARAQAEKRARIIRGWDDTSQMALQYPQIGRWLPGYGFTLHIIREQQFGNQTIPVAELRDPFTVYPGSWGVTQQPEEVAIFRQVSRTELSKAFPHISERIENYVRAKTGRGVPIIGQSSGWEGNKHSPLTMVEYLCDEGTYIMCPELEMQLAYIPNPLTEGPAFVLTKRFAFDKLAGQFTHGFGLMAMMAKLNILGLIAAEDSVFREVNIIGELIGDEYERGRFATNLFEPGTRVEKPTSEQLNQIWQTINVLERQFRVVSGYHVSQDGQSPNSFATGEGIRELGTSAAENVKEYQTAIKHSIELIDRKRLEWEDVLHPDESKRVYWFEGGTQFEETYTPAKDIAKDYRTERIYGAMATFDEAQKIIAGLQLLQARVIDRRTLQENFDGFHNVSLINERIDQDMAKQQMIEGLGQRFAERDPAAALALTEILQSPKTANETLLKLFTPQEPEMSPEEQAMMQQEAEGGMGMPPPPVQTILSQMEAPGGGVQSVGRIA